MSGLVSYVSRKVPRKYLQRFAGPVLKFYAFTLRGKSVTCPVCSKNFRHLLPYGRFNARKNALCPNCLSLERHRLIWLYLKQKTNFFDQRLKVLHIAPEACFIKRFEKWHGDNYITADLESPLAKIKADIHHLPFEDSCFDVVLCNHVLEHVDDDIAAIRELSRVMKPGAFAILQVPFFNPVPEKTFEDPAITDPLEREKAFGQDDHVRKYGKDYPERIARGGLHPYADSFAETLAPEIVRQYAIVPSEIIYKGVKE